MAYLYGERNIIAKQYKKEAVTKVAVLRSNYILGKVYDIMNSIDKFFMMM